MTRKEHIRLIPYYAVFLLLTIISANHIFFWDAVQLASLHAHHFYENPGTLILPDDLDSGHIPIFGYYLSLMWKIFGRNLPVSHFAIFPFLIGIVYQAYILIHRYIPKDFAYVSLMLFLADPTFLSQASMVSSDIALFFFFLLSLNAVLSNKRLLMTIGFLGLFAMSMRGMMISLALLFFDLYKNYDWKRKSFLELLKMSMPYLPAFLFAVIYFTIHYTVKGWFAYHPDSPWAGSFERVGLTTMIYNLGIMGWRIIDFGRIFLWVTAFILIIPRFKKFLADTKLREMIILAILLTICLGYSFITYRYLQGHRYILPVFSIISLAVAYIIWNYVHTRLFRFSVITFIVFALLSGNFWVYPEKVAQGWDSSLAHWPYFEMREDMINYMETHGIDYNEVASDFPNTTKRKYLELNDDDSRHLFVDLDQNKYVLYSNVYNNFSDEEIDRLKSEFIELKNDDFLGVFMILYKRPEK